jgi:hypothetical protein
VLFKQCRELIAKDDPSNLYLDSLDYKKRNQWFYAHAHTIRGVLCRPDNTPSAYKQRAPGDAKSLAKANLKVVNDRRETISKKRKALNHLLASLPASQAKTVLLSPRPQAANSDANNS